MIIELVRPCPNCKAQEDNLKIVAVPSRFNSDNETAVECRTCQMRGPSATCFASAIRRWNRLLRNDDLIINDEEKIIDKK